MGARYQLQISNKNVYEKKQASKFKVSIFVTSEVSMAMLFRKRMRRFL